MSSPSLADRLVGLAQLFNERSLDVPEGLLDRACLFRLNGVAYEDTMGRPITDPIVRLVARGPAAYRFLAQGLRYAVPDVQVSVDSVVPEDLGEGLASVMGTVEGTPRGTTSPLRVKAAVALVVGPSGAVQEFAVMINDAHAAAITDVRKR